MTDDDLCYLTAKDALKLFRARKISPVDIIKAQIARSEVINPAINCFTDRYFEEALDQAKAAEAVYASRSERPRPLEGVSLAVKDAQRLKGKRTTHGSRPGATIWSDWACALSSVREWSTCTCVTGG